MQHFTKPLQMVFLIKKYWCWWMLWNWGIGNNCWNDWLFLILPTLQILFGFLKDVNGGDGVKTLITQVMGDPLLQHSTPPKALWWPLQTWLLSLSKIGRGCNQDIGIDWQATFNFLPTLKMTLPLCHFWEKQLIFRLKHEWWILLVDEDDNSDDE